MINIFYKLDYIKTQKVLITKSFKHSIFYNIYLDYLNLFNLPINVNLISSGPHKRMNNLVKTFKGNKFQGIISHHDGRIDPAILLAALNKALKTKNIKKINDQVIQIEKKLQKWNVKLKSGKRLTSEVVILCNSIDSLKLIKKEIHNIRLKPVLGQAIEISHEEDDNFLSLPKVLNINDKNLITINKKKIIIGSTDEYSFKPDEFYINKLFEFIKEKPNWLNKKNISRRWFGIRSRPEGEPSPILKSLDKGLILCSGFYKNGVLLAPACSHWVSEEIMKHI